MEKKHKGKWKIWVDTGGTFTDCLGIDPRGKRHHAKVLSNSGLRGTVREVLAPDLLKIDQDWEAPDQFVNTFQFRLLTQSHEDVAIAEFDAGRSLITLSDTIAEKNWNGNTFEAISSEESPVLAARLVTQSVGNGPLPVSLRLATTRGTNALLERQGAPTALFITGGFGDFPKIGTQQRPDLFALNIHKPDPVYRQIVEVAERIDANGNVLQEIDLAAIKKKAQKMLEHGITSAAVALMNSYENPLHEQKVKTVLKNAGFEYISVSSDLNRFVKFLPRMETVLVNAYLAPVFQNYLEDVASVIGRGNFSVMTSAGGLKESEDFAPKDGLLSGPAAGVVGAAAVGKKAGVTQIISFDMGGTSTDVAKYDRDFEYVFQHRVGSARLMAPALAIETVAAGGGSVCRFDGHTLQVGPESAQASPGPACYGAGGPLTLTDVNLLAGRLDEQNFHIPLHKEAARKKLHEIAASVSKKESNPVEDKTILEGFLNIANQRMGAAIEKISLRKGYDPKAFALVSFGGAGGQHSCAIAEKLGINKIIVPSDAGILSAYGLGHAVKEHFEQQQVLQPLQEIAERIPTVMNEITDKALTALSDAKTPQKKLNIRRRLLSLRIKGQESTLEIPYQKGMNIEQEFEEAYRQRYAHWVDDSVLEVESMRVVVSTKPELMEEKNNEEPDSSDWKPIKHKDILFNGEQITTPVYRWSDVKKGQKITGPALILDPYCTIVVEPNWKAQVNPEGSLILDHKPARSGKVKKSSPEAIALELFTHRLTSIAEKMGEMLQRTALSVNIKERHDFSCALLNTEGELVVNAPHIPVHLGALGMCVRRVREQIAMAPGDVVVTNYPACGGSHLPDVTLITPVFTDDEQLIGYAANRAHHAEIGGIRPGSMPPNATNLAQEGVVIPPRYLVRKGESRTDTIREQLLSSDHPTRNIAENMADLQAQLAANQQGAEALKTMADTFGPSDFHHYMKQLKNRAAQLMQKTIRHIKSGTYQSRELLDDGTPLCATWKINDHTIVLDFTGTGGVHPINLNATPAIVNSVVMYVLRVLINEPIPLNEGLLDPITISLPECLLNPRFSDDPEKSPAVVGGNVEVSQRLTDTLLKPFERIACGQGTMNNVLFGNENFAYYETVGGGSGAGPDFDGTDAVHQHMTNTSGTDPEILEKRYPVRLNRYAIRKNSGGDGAHRGGDGIIRDITFLEPVELSVLTQHRIQAPYGLQGGEAGKKGRQWVIRKNGDEEILEPSDGRELKTGDRFILHTPGGGGFGEKDA